MAEKIYIRNPSGGLEPVAEEPFKSEELLQDLVGQHPELLAGEQMRPGDPLRWILIRREMPVEGWAVDHLLLDQDARPTLVEVKRGSNREIRRNIVGQMLDYAATAAGVWSGGGLRSAFEQDAITRNADPLVELRKLLKPDDDTEPDDEVDFEDLVDEFWDRATTNLEAKRLRLLFVADEIPTELERVVDFLNEQTRDSLEVLAVEVKQYRGRFGDALVSRVIGQVGQQHQQIASVTGRKETILERCNPAARAALLTLTAAAEAAGARVRWARIGVSISMPCSLWQTRVFVARFRWWSDNDDVPFEIFVHRHAKRPFPPELRSVLQNWLDNFNEEDYVVRHTKSPQWDEGWAMTEDNFAKNVGSITERLLKTLQEIKAL